MHGRAHKVGANVDTDAIIPARYLTTSDPVELAAHCLEGYQADWVKGVSPGDILVTGPNFGCGSSREHAPLAIKGAGIAAVIAHSFARIFYRNGFNLGLLLIEAGDLVDELSQGDMLRIDLDNSLIVNQTSDKTISMPPLPRFMREILEAGGLVPYARAIMEQRATEIQSQ